MPIRGNRWAFGNFEKSLAGQVEYDLRETTVVGSMNRAGEQLFEPNIDPDAGFFAVILRRESDTPLLKGSSTKPLARFRCHVFSGPHAEIPFSLQVLDYPSQNTPLNQLSLDHFTAEMFPVFTCDNANISNSLKSAKPGTVVKVDYENRENLSSPRIIETTSFPVLTPENFRTTISQFLSGTPTNAGSLSQQQSSQINTPETQKRLRKESLAKTNNQSLGLLFPITGGRVSTNPKSRFGPRFLDSGAKRKHAGVDIGGRYGQAILAVESGRVIQLQRSRSFYGWYVVVEHNKKGVRFWSLYAHMGKFDVRLGKKVARGQKLGEIGKTGKTSGPHVHFELRVSSNSRDGAVEPYIHFDNLPGKLP